ncbi:MAG: GNAT family N-acetyltransferase, partial [Candidatus Micrarchaeia archaeon]
MQVHIRRARSSDIKSIEMLNQRYNFELNRDWKKLATDKNTEIYVAIDSGKIVGFTGLIHYNWNDTLQILDVFVDPLARGKGYGRQIINFLLSKARRMKGYRSIIAEAPAKEGIDKFYAKLGFRKCGYNDRWYTNRGNGDIAIFMSYDLE